MASTLGFEADLSENESPRGNRGLCFPTKSQFRSYVWLNGQEMAHSRQKDCKHQVVQVCGGREGDCAQKCSKSCIDYNR